ncbi:hypothetical protein BU15DRAFT_68805 [Melanogaster broomeanus]|nr:hypothetical protein BU15DRAFT_68805 [Melanogaster broomeanus]
MLRWRLYSGTKILTIALGDDQVVAAFDKRVHASEREPFEGPNRIPDNIGILQRIYAISCKLEDNGVDAHDIFLIGNNVMVQTARFSMGQSNVEEQPSVSSVQAAVNGDEMEETFVVPSMLPHVQIAHEAIFGGKCTDRP